MLTVGSLFSGIGGFELGLERTGGFKTVWQCEKDEFCLKVLAKHWPDVKRFTDIKEMGIEENIPYVDVICGGFPCQPVSCAGKRKGKEDKRWLWPEFYRIVCQVKPRWVLVENVPGLLSADSGRLFAGILRDLASSGYDAEWNIVSAAGVGAPHLRKRVFVVAHSNKFDGHNGGPGTSEVCRKREQATIISGSEDDVAHTASQQDNTQYIESRGLGEQFRGTLADRREAIRPEDRQASHNVLGGCSQDVAHTISLGRHGRAGMFGQGWRGESENGCAESANTDIERLEEWNGGNSESRSCTTTDGCNRWSVEPRLGMFVDGLSEGLADAWRPGWEDGTPRIAAGVKGRVDRLRALGNAIVPQCSEYVGRCILEAEARP